MRNYLIIFGDFFDSLLYFFNVIFHDFPIEISFKKWKYYLKFLKKSPKIVEIIRNV